MKKVLIVTYYWPPAGGGGVQRVAKFCKYLPQYGWEPVVLTVKNGNYAASDDTLMKDVKHVRNVYRAPSIEPHNWYKKLSDGRKRDGRAGTEASSGRIIRRFGEYVRLNLFIPDSRVGWLHHACRTGMDAIRAESPDIIMSSAPPYTTHLIGRHLAEKTHLPWLADFRDPWLENVAYNTAPRLGVVKWINRRLERSVLRKADMVTSIGDELSQLLISKTADADERTFKVISNGYDEEDVPHMEPGSADHFFLSYFGTLYPQRCPKVLLEAISELQAQDREFAGAMKLKVTGRIHPETEAELRLRLSDDTIEVAEYVDHNLLWKSLLLPQVFLLTIDDVPSNKLIITGKIFEYLPTGNPILAIGPVSGDAATVIRETGTGDILEYRDKEGVKRFIKKHYLAWREGKLNRGRQSFPQYHRRNLTGKLAGVLDELSSRRA